MQKVTTLLAPGTDLQLMTAREQPGIRTWGEPKNGIETENGLGPMFIVLLSDVDDSIIKYNFYAVMNKPTYPLPV